MAIAKDAAQRPYLLRAGLLSGLLLLLIIAVVVASLAGRTRPLVSQSPAPVPVRTVTVGPRSVDLVRSGLGVVQAWNVATITPQVSGMLIDLPFREGQAVRAGDVLARIDPQPFQAALHQAVAKKAQDAAKLANDKTDLERFTTLLSKDSIAVQQVDTQRALVAQFEAQVAGDQAAVESAQIQLNYTTIKAPFASIVGIRSIDIGNVVSPTSAIVTLTQIEPIAAIFSLPQADLNVLQTALTHGNPAVLAYDQQGKTQLARGTLEVINNTIDQTTGTIKLKARFDNQTHALWPGQFVQVHVVTSTDPSAIVVPSEVVQRGPNGPYVWLIASDNTAQLKPITIAQIQGSKTVLKSGLSAGDHIVVDGQFRLSQGALVVETSAPTEHAAR
jgi:membrane fusion protein, multidrug efflux system